MGRICLLLFWGAFVANAQPTWTPIMNAGGDTGESSAQYFEFNQSLGTYPSQISSTYVGYHNPLSLPLDSSGNIQQFGNATGTCTNSGPASQAYRSYLGPWNFPASGYKGLETLLTFNYNASDITGSSDYFGASPNLEQAVFFHEQQCYNGGREYGVLLNGLNGNVEFYTLTNANLGGGYVAHDIAGTGWTGSQYYFTMWPVDDGNNTCHFETRIKSPAPYYTILRTGTISGTSISNAGILNFDSSFCSAVLGDQGYVTAATKVTPNVSFSSGAHSSFNMNLVAINIGK